MKTKQTKQMYIMIMVFGALPILIGVYKTINEGNFQEELSSIFLGISLFGVAFMEYKKMISKVD